MCQKGLVIRRVTIDDIAKLLPLVWFLGPLG